MPGGKTRTEDMTEWIGHRAGIGKAPRTASRVTTHFHIGF